MPLQNPLNFGLEPLKQHQHSYRVTATDMTIVRYCPVCGKTWVIIRYAAGGLFDHRWKEIEEP